MPTNTHVRNLLCLLAMCLVLQACGAKQNIPTMNVNYYPQCYRPFEDLKATQNEVAAKTAASAAIGGLLGAGLGALSGDWKKALIGGIAGATLAGVGGYYNAKKNQIKDDRARFASYQADMNQDMMNATRVEKYALAAMQCYAREFDSLLVQYKYGQITKLDAENRYREIREGMAQIAVILTNSRNDLLQKDAEYRKAIEEEARARNEPVPATATLDSRRSKAAQQKTAAVRKTSKKRKVKPQKDEMSALAALTDEIEVKKNEADARPQQVLAANAGTDQPANLVAVSHYYESQGMESVLRIEEAQNMRERTLTAMSNAAANAGIDMI